MSKVEKFEDLNCWKKARELSKIIYKFTNKKYFSKDFGLKDQIRRASVSILSNIAEGFPSYSNKEFIRYLSYSARSATEIQSQLYVALDQEYINNNEFNDTYNLCEECRKLCLAFIKYLSKIRKDKQCLEIIR